MATKNDANRERVTGKRAYFPAAPEDIEFSAKFKPELILDPDHFSSIFQGIEDKPLAFDTETTGLDPSSDALVGCSLSLSPYDGVYIPFAHQKGRNAPPEIKDMVYQLLLRNKVLMFNSLFDNLVLHYAGYDPRPIKLLDTQVLCHILDSNVNFSLKQAAQHYLGRTPPTFEETVGKSFRFDEITPEQGCYYAAADTANTFGLFQVTYSHVLKEAPYILKLDMETTKEMFDYALPTVPIDCDYLKHLYDHLTSELKRTDREIFKAVGYPFLLSSRQQVATALQFLGLDTKQRTPSGDMKVDEESLNKLDHPVGHLIANRASLEKQRGSYVAKLMDKSETRFSYLTCAVPTGRFASGNRSSDYYATLNAQNFTKPKECFYRVEHTGANNDRSILGYEFTPASKEAMDEQHKYVEGFDQVINVRKALTVPDRDDWYYLSIDYAAMELLMVAQLSGDPVMMQAFRDGVDLHYATAVRMFGQENYNKGARRKAKMANFGLVFGGSAASLHHSSGLPYDECEDIYKRYWSVYSHLWRWERQQITQCISNGGIVQTLWGRPRRLASYLTSPDRKYKKYGERSVISHLVQGTCADVMRHAYVSNGRFIKNNMDVVRFGLAVHDEFDFMIRKDALYDVVPVLTKNMEILPPNFELAMATSMELGYSYGELYPFAMNEETGKYEPEYV